MSSARNTRIARSRLGPPRFGRYDDFAGAGPVVIYKLAPEELIKYGPVTPPEKAEKIRLKYRRLCGGSGGGPSMTQSRVPGQKNKERSEDMPPKLDISKEQIESALRVTHGNVKKAMAILKIGVGTFYDRVKEFGIDVASFRTPEAGIEEAQDAGIKETTENLAPGTGAPETAGPETKEQATALETAETAGAAVEDIFSAWLKIERKSFIGRKESMISIDRRGTVRLLSGVGGAFQPDDRIEFFLSPDRARLAVRKVDGIGGFRLRADSKSRAKTCNCAELKNLLLEAGVELPARFAVEWDERLQAWVGRR